MDEKHITTWSIQEKACPDNGSAKLIHSKVERWFSVNAISYDSSW